MKSWKSTKRRPRPCARKSASAEHRDADEQPLLFVEFTDLVFNEAEERWLYRQPMAGKSFARFVSALVFHASIIPYILRKSNDMFKINTITPSPKTSKAPLLKVSKNDRIPMLDSSVVEVCQRVSASETACPVRCAKEGFCNYLMNELRKEMKSAEEIVITGIWMWHAVVHRRHADEQAARDYFAEDLVCECDGYDRPRYADFDYLDTCTIYTEDQGEIFVESGLDGSLSIKSSEGSSLDASKVEIIRKGVRTDPLDAPCVRDEDGAECVPLEVAALLTMSSETFVAENGFDPRKLAVVLENGFIQQILYDGRIVTPEELSDGADMLLFFGDYRYMSGANKVYGRWVQE